jgi:tRNA(Ile)-lysidine synthetase-like protein
VRYLVAVSGGIDSVVLLHQLVVQGKHELIVAHFDHGIRPDSADDARFVEGLAGQYGLVYVGQREELGGKASEELARRHRYGFLRRVAKEYDATIVTAHHVDDVIETMAINIKRGTGWRGIAVLQTAGIVRPLLMTTKAEIRQYALERRLEWAEDSTNASDDYLRNQLRHLFASLLTVDQKEVLLTLWKQQLTVKVAIDQELEAYIEGEEYSRYFYNHIDEQSALELLRGVIVAKTGVSPMRPQLQRAILAIKTARPRTTFEIGAGVKLVFNIRTFIVETP